MRSDNKDRFFKILIVAILAYQHVYAEAFGQIPFLLTALYILLDIKFVFYFYPMVGHLRISKICFPLIVFFVYATIFGYLITSYRSAFLGYISNGIEYLILFLSTYTICKKEKNCDFLISSVLVLSMLSILIALQRNEYIYNRLVISNTSNANTLGNICLIGFCACLYIAIKKQRGWLVLLICSPLIIYTTILTASKKAILIIIILLTLYVLFRLKDWIRKHFIKVCLVALMLIVVYFVNRSNITEALFNTTLYERIQNINNIDTGRIILYENAYKVFLEHPIFGVGYQCFQLASGTLYSHSAYAEVLSGTGLIGFMIWICFYIGLFCKSISSVNKNRNNLILIWCLIWIICQMVLDFSSVSLYSPINMALLGIVAGILEAEPAERKSRQNIRR